MNDDSLFDDDHDFFDDMDSTKEEEDSNNKKNMKNDKTDQPPFSSDFLYSDESRERSMYDEEERIKVKKEGIIEQSDKIFRYPLQEPYEPTFPDFENQPVPDDSFHKKKISLKNILLLCGCLLIVYAILSIIIGIFH